MANFHQQFSGHHHSAGMEPCWIRNSAPLLLQSWAWNWFIQDLNNKPHKTWRNREKLSKKYIILQYLSACLICSICRSKSGSTFKLHRDPHQPCQDTRDSGKVNICWDSRSKMLQQINQKGFGKFSRAQGALRFAVPTHHLANTFPVIAFQNTLSIQNSSAFQPANVRKLFQQQNHTLKALTPMTATLACSRNKWLFKKKKRKK